jgi:hypothetical protein
LLLVCSIRESHEPISESLEAALQGFASSRKRDAQRSLSTGTVRRAVHYDDSHFMEQEPPDLVRWTSQFADIDHHEKARLGDQWLDSWNSPQALNREVAADLELRCHPLHAPLI